MLIGGVDEAGRGCIVGPMVIALATIEPSRERQLTALGVKDSKKLSAARREALYGPIHELCEVRTLHLSAREITELMDRHNLNEIEALSIAKLLGPLDPASTVFIDSPDNIPKHFGLRIQGHLGPDKSLHPQLVCENKADDLHPIVGAASVVAKVERDREIEKIKKIVGYDFNSGYTSDPHTIAFLARRANDPLVRPFLREKWSTLKTLSQRKISDF